MAYPTLGLTIMKLPYAPVNRVMNGPVPIPEPEPMQPEPVPIPVEPVISICPPGSVPVFDVSTQSERCMPVPEHWTAEERARYELAALEREKRRQVGLAPVPKEPWVRPPELPPTREGGPVPLDEPILVPAPMAPPVPEAMKKLALPALAALSFLFLR